MTKFSVLVLATLVGAGITGAAVVFNGQLPGDSALVSAETQTAISSEAGVAWQALRRPKQADPAPQEQATFRQEQVTVQHEQVTARTDTFRTSVSVATAAPSSDPASLARALQRELKRAGCYNGEINGIWTPSTRQAMKTYTDIVNARLPVTNPDPVLLALIQGDQHTCREDRVAAPSPPTSKPVTTGEGSTAAFLEPPMALAGPKTPEPDGNISIPQEPAQKARKRQAGSQDRSSHRAARAEHWSVKLWRESTN